MINRILDIHIDEIRNNFKNTKSKQEVHYEYNYELLGIDAKLLKSEKYKILEKLINDYLVEIKNIFLKNHFDFLKANYDNYFKYVDFDSSKDISEKNKYFITRAKNFVVYELCSKTIGVNGRSITLPIKVSDIEEHIIPTFVKPMYIGDVLIFTIIHLAIILNDLKNIK